MQSAQKSTTQYEEEEKQNRITFIFVSTERSALFCTSFVKKRILMMKRREKQRREDDDNNKTRGQKEKHTKKREKRKKKKVRKKLTKKSRIFFSYCRFVVACVCALRTFKTIYIYSLYKTFSILAKQDLKYF